MGTGNPMEASLGGPHCKMSAEVKIWILKTYLILQAIYFCNICEANIFAKINRCKKLVRPVYVMRKGKQTRKFINTKWHSISKIQTLIAAKIGMFAVIRRCLNIYITEESANQFSADSLTTRNSLRGILKGIVNKQASPWEKGTFHIGSGKPAEFHQSVCCSHRQYMELRKLQLKSDIAQPFE